jgi:hypothetical protein
MLLLSQSPRLILATHHWNGLKTPFPPLIRPPLPFAQIAHV